jgi:NDP-sugar pyrophosphorylase family protein
MNNITAIILAGGEGIRLQSVVSDCPKVLAEINGRPFITYLLDQLVESGFQSVVLCTGYKAEMVERAIGVSYRSMRVSYSVEERPLGTFGAIAKASLLAEEENILAMNGDSYIDTSLSEFVDWGLGNRVKAGILLAQALDSSRYGRVSMGKDGKIIAFEEKKDSCSPGLINAGIYFLPISTIRQFNSPTVQPLNNSTSQQFNNSTFLSIPHSIEKEIFPSLAAAGDLHGYPVNADFIDIGTPESYGKAKEIFADR